MTDTDKSKYAGVGTSKAQRVGNYVRPGHYLARVDQVEEGKAFKKGDFVAIQLTIIKTFDGAVPGFDYNRKVQLSLHTPGEAVTDICMVQNVAFEARVKAFAMVAGDLTEADFTAESRPGETIEELVGPKQPVAGNIVELRAETVVKKESKAKPEADLTNGDIYTRIGYVRRVPFTELGDLLDEQTIGKFLPDWEAQVAAEA